MTSRRSFLAAAAGLPASLIAQTAANQPWVKKGRILKPGFAGALSNNLLSAPSVVKLKNGRLRMYFWTRHESADAEGQGILNYIFAAEASPDNLHNWKLVSSEPMLKPTPGNKLSDRGPSFPWVLPRQDGPWLMYYAVWGSWAPPGSLSNRTSLALSDDEGLTWKTIREPLLPLGEPGSFDGGLTGSVCVLRTAPQMYQMWYTAGERRQHFDDGTSDLIAHIGHATSKDGIDWTKTAAENPVFPARQQNVTPYENIVSKPTVLLMDGTYHMWFSLRAHDGRGYRISYARSNDGLHWTRPFNKQVIPPTAGGFDAKNQSYPNVIEQDGEFWMFYVGDQFGSTGIGLATLKKSALG